MLSAVYAITNASEFKSYFYRMSTINIFSTMAGHAMCLTILGNIFIFFSILIWEKIGLGNQSSYTARVNPPRLDTSAVSQLNKTESLRAGLAKTTKSPDHSKMTLSKTLREPVAIFAFGITYLILYSLSHPSKSLPDPEMG